MRMRLAVALCVLAVGCGGGGSMGGPGGGGHPGGSKPKKGASHNSPDKGQPCTVVVVIGTDRASIASPDVKCSESAEIDWVFVNYDGANPHTLKISKSMKDKSNGNPTDVIDNDISADVDALGSTIITVKIKPGHNGGHFKYTVTSDGYDDDDPDLEIMM